MIQNISNKLLRQLEEEMSSISNEQNDPFVKMRKALKASRISLGKLRTVFLEAESISETEEVHFFKIIKPAFYKWKIYHAELYSVESNIPAGGADIQRVFFESELRVVERFLLLHPFQYQYYRMDMCELDTFYFLRKVDLTESLLPEQPEIEPIFSSPGDYLFAKFRAMDMLKDWLMERINFLKRHPVLSYDASEIKSELRWTGDKIHLAELAYSLHLSGQINNGQAGVAQIFRWFEEHFVVSIGVPAKRFAEIRARKRLSRTQFVDSLRDALVKKMDQDDLK
ncbi:RteC domain-containing protein [Pedobacter aquatilis]|uniref:RteC domain-containing protein n=1 Tax=Pedobacter aquatilis TaxID=351343 RepID=UPI00292CA739|nr:RteC domain-containing protein [Pedobacter aquatilis]